MADRRAITRALESAILHGSEPMVLSDPHQPDAPIVAANRAFEELTGYARDEIIGRNCRFLQGPKTDPESPRRIARALADGHGCVEWIVNHRKDGTPFWNLLFISPVLDADGELLHFFGNQQDITKGSPSWLPDYGLGRARMTPEAQAEFHALLAEIAENTREDDSDQDAAARARSLERVLAAARRLSQITTRLEPGAPDEAG